MVFKYSLLYKFIFILSIAVAVGGFVLLNFGADSICLAFTEAARADGGEIKGEVVKEGKSMNIAQMPQDFGEAGAFAMELLGGLPNAVKESWSEAKEIWRKTWVKWWVEKIAPWLRQKWQKIKIFLDKKIGQGRAILSGKYYDTMEQRGSVFRQELEKEKQELMGELSKMFNPIKEKIKGMFSLRSLWGKIKLMVN